MYRFNTRSLAAVVASAAFAGACAHHAAAPRTPAPAPINVGASLYQRLGGYDAIAAVTDDFFRRLHGDTTIMSFFAGLDTTAMKHIRQMVVDQLCAASGGPCFYAGKSMKDAHAALDIDNAVFDKFVGHFQASLHAFSVPSREQNEVMGALLSMKGDVIKQK
jgi:hemoglobin